MWTVTFRTASRTDMVSIGTSDRPGLGGRMDTIITCDNGIAAANEIRICKDLGMTVIVTDHHEVPFDEIDGGTRYILPPADAVVDPKQKDCAYPFKGSAGLRLLTTDGGLMEAMGKDAGRCRCI